MKPLVFGRAHPSNVEPPGPTSPPAHRKRESHPERLVTRSKVVKLCETCREPKRSCQCQT